MPYISFYGANTPADTGSTPSPDFSHVVLLVGFDGTDGSTTFTDESSYSRSLSGAGDAQIDTGVSQFGSGSLLLDGTGDAVLGPPITFDQTTGGPGNSIGANDDFQIEAWIRFASGANMTAEHDILSHWNDSFVARDFIFCYDNGALLFKYTSDGTTVTTAVTGSWSPSTGTWYHAAFSRVGGISRVFADGVKLAESAVSNFATHDTSTNLKIGAHETAIGSYTAVFNGNIDELRVAVYEGGGGSGKLYEADFTPPTAAFPRS
jgi:hypothetical protein